MTPLKSVTVHEGQFIDMHHRHFALADGRKAVYEVAHPKSDAVVIIPLRVVHGGTEVALVKQYRPAIDQSLWEFPAGKIDPGEQPHETASRECAEELGLAPHRLESIGQFYSSPGLTDELIYFFIATDLHIVGEPEEGIDVEWVSTNVLTDCLTTGTIKDMKTAAGAWFVARYRGMM